MKNIFKILILVIFYVSCGNDTTEILYDNLKLDGGIYYFENKPFTGIGFSDWSKDKRKKTVVFENGQIKSIVRYYQSTYIEKPMDSLIFNEKQELIYQKRWVTDETFIEISDPKEMYGPSYISGFERLSATQIEDELKNETNSFSPLLTYEEFKDTLFSITNKNHLFVSDWLRFNKSNDLTRLLGGERYRYSGDRFSNPTEKFISDLDNLDFHFTGQGEPQIDGTYKYVTDLYLYPEFGSEGSVPGFNIHTRYINGETNEPFKTKHTVFDYSHYFRYGDKDEKYYDRLLNSFYLVKKISPSKFKFFIRPYLKEDPEYNDIYNPIFYVLNIDYNPPESIETFGGPFNESLIHNFELNLEFYSPYHFSETLFLSNKGRGFFSRSIFDEYVRNEKNFSDSIKQIIDDPDEENQLVDLYNEMILKNDKNSSRYKKKDPFLNLRKDEYVVVAPSGLNLRSSPSPKSRTITKIDFYEKVEIIRRTPRSLTVKDYDTLGNYLGEIKGYWVKVNYLNNQTGKTLTGYLFDGFLKNQIPLK